ncbi:hypothetical protein A6R68_23369 [Neotoma lepida]|uniref:Uncharacterized protein n=1 Tax=Neotoma lepida TaxID=56216 RepID=A0A1A6HW04_NEOLE|nr:hypothetical protein A6R68_23369 [Neotoma lepida]
MGRKTGWKQAKAEVASLNWRIQLVTEELDSVPGSLPPVRDELREAELRAAELGAEKVARKLVVTIVEGDLDPMGREAETPTELAKGVAAKLEKMTDGLEDRHRRAAPRFRKDAEPGSAASPSDQDP